jgi:D-aminopeptidase
VIRRTRTLHFQPGTRFSYVNQNFRLLSDILEDRAGRSFAELLRTRLFDRIGMDSAFLAADTRAMPDGTEGYEGSQGGGFRAAENRIHWTGDAGLGASLDDMIAWERHIDATRDDPGSLYQRLAAPVQFSTGARAGYGFGLGRRAALGRPATGHGGALRGWRSHRLYVPSERISIVVLLNHLSEAHEAAADLFAAAVGETRPAPLAQGPRPGWLGAYIEPETGISVRIEAAPSGQARLRYGHGAELLDVSADGTAGVDETRLRPGDGGLRMDLPGDNQSSVLRPCAPPTASLDAAGRYRCGELDAELTITDAGGALYGGFSGFLGQGRMELLEPVGADVWALPCPRGLDHTPPGDWTLVFKRNGGRPNEVQVGCWLARGLTYERVRD